jgi:hypothetical protein
VVLAFQLEDIRSQSGNDNPQHDNQPACMQNVKWIALEFQHVAVGGQCHTCWLEVGAVDVVGYV